MTPCSGRGGCRLLGLGIGDQVAIAHRSVGDGEFEYAVKDPAPAARSPSIEAENELVEVALQVRRLNRALMGAEQPPLGQGRDTMDRGEQFAGVLAPRASRPLTARLMDVAELVDAAVALPTVGDNPSARLDVLGHEGVQ